MLKNALKTDSEVWQYLERLLPQFSQTLEARVGELESCLDIDNQTAEGMRLLFGSKDYDRSLSVVTHQWIAVTKTRDMLSKRHRKSVPVKQQSAIFKRLIMTNREEEDDDHKNNGPYLLKTIEDVVSYGSFNEKTKRRAGSNRKTIARVPSEKMARALILVESVRMLDYYYPTES